MEPQVPWKDRDIHRPEHTRPDKRSEVEVMFFDLLKAVGAVVAVLSEVLKLETEAVPVSPPVPPPVSKLTSLR